MQSSGSSEPVFYGRLSDGKSARSVDVDVRLGATGVEFRGPKAPSAHWPYTTLSAAEPLTDHAIDALLASDSAPGAWLFVGEGAFARSLAQKAPHLTARAQRWRHTRPWLLASAVLLLMVLAIPFFGLSPSHAVASLMPDKTRAALGKSIINDLTAGRRTCDGAKGVAALSRLTTRLSEAAGGGQTFKVIVSDWGLLNAFAAPGEQIVLTRSLIERAGSSDEIAGVLAHEMGHGLERHPESAIVRVIGLSAGLQLLMGGSGSTLANAGLVLAELSYSRDAERAADVHALRILKSAGIPARGLADFFRRVMKIERKGELGEAFSHLEVLRTHPGTKERLAVVEAAPTYDARPALSAADWKALKGICKEGDSRSGRTPDSPRPRKPLDPGRDI